MKYVLVVLKHLRPDAEKKKNQTSKNSIYHHYSFSFLASFDASFQVRGILFYILSWDIYSYFFYSGTSTESTPDA